jgi:hypothetical protein
LGELREVKKIQYWINRLLIKETYKSDKNKSKNIGLASDSGPEPSRKKE